MPVSTQHFYPDMRIGDDVMFATDPNTNAMQWRLGKVRAVKTLSCDIVVFSEDGTEYRHDCLHADDPQVASTRVWAERGRGIFRLASHEIERRDDRLRLKNMFSRMSQLEEHLESLVLSSVTQSKPQRTKGE